MDSDHSVPPRIDWQRELAAHLGWLRTIVLARCGDRHAADEILQEVSLATLKPQPRPTEAERVAPWLYQVAVRQCLLYRRGHGRRRKLVGHLANSGSASGAEIQEQALAALLVEERRDKVREALFTIPEREREILSLKYVENWSYRQISEHLGLSAHAVAHRLRQARGRLRAELAAYELMGTDQ